MTFPQPDTLEDCSGASTATRTTPPTKPKFDALSFADAKAGGKAMYDRWVAMTPNAPGTPDPPFDRSDAAWSDMFRAGFEALRWGK